jgi:MFS family permease
MNDRPSNVRWRIVGLLLLYAALVHFNRISIAVAGTERLMEQFKISEKLMGWLSSAYLLTYTLMMTPGGWFIDRFGARAALLVVGFGSALCVGLCGGAGFVASAALMIPALIAIRLVMGVTNAPFHPGAAHAVSKWIPGPQRAWANGLVNAAALAGISSTYYLFGFMMDRLDWPAAFVTAAAVTGLVAAAWWATAANGPSDHPRANEAERQLILRDASGKSVPARLTAGAPWRKRSVMLLTLSYAAVGYFQYMFFYWMQYYFDKVLGVGKENSRLYATIPAVAMALGMAAGGWLTDQAQSRWGPRTGRAAWTILCMVASAAFLGAGAACREPALIVTHFSLALAWLGACEGAFWTSATDLGGERSGTAAAIVNTGGNAGGALAPILTPILSELLGWKGAIAVACVFCALGALCWFWIDPDEGSAAQTSLPKESLRDGVAPTPVS